jgi:hypothetical protein
VIASEVGCRSKAALLASCLLIACGDFTHSNPFDPETRVTLTITGPDTVTAIGDTLQFTLSTSPQFAHEAPEWRIEQPPLNQNFAVLWVRGGILRSATAEAVHVRPTDVRITAGLRSGRVARKTITFLPRPVALRVDGCSPGPLRAISHSAIGGGTWICTRIVDRRGTMLLTDDVPVGTVRQPSVASLGVNNIRIANGERFEVRGLDTGSTELVFTRGAFVDSVRLTVRQVLTGFLLDPPECRLFGWGMRLSVGQTVQLRASVGIDSLGRAMRDTTGQGARASRLVFSSANLSAVTVTTDGLMTGVGRGSSTISGINDGSDGGKPLYSSCYVAVP